MSPQIADIDRFIASGSTEDVVTVARRAIERLFADNNTARTGQCVLLPEDKLKEVYVVTPLRPIYTLQTEEEFAAELDRRIKSPYRRFLSADEFLALLDESA